MGEFEGERSLQTKLGGAGRESKTETHLKTVSASTHSMIGCKSL